MLYENQEFPEIHSIDCFNNEILSELSSDSEWCQNEVRSKESEKVEFDESQSPIVNNTNESQRVKEPDKSHLTSVAAINPPDELPGFQAVDWPDGELGIDLRPHIWDPQMKEFLLVDSGSQITAVKPDPNDKPVPGRFLKAVNGSKIKCYGKKRIEVKIG